MWTKILTTVFLLLFIVTISQQVTKRDGQWSPWANMTRCSKTCDGGTIRQVRTCNKPQPQGGGAICTRNDGSLHIEEYKLLSCNNVTCMKCDWTNWTSCENCTISTESRSLSYNCTTTDPDIEERECNRWNLTACPDPCLKTTCPKFAVCNNTSTEEKPDSECYCVLGYVMNVEKSACIRAPPERPTPRPIPVLPEEQKTVATVVSKTASTVLIVFVGITLTLFTILRIYTPDRIIQMNMEISLLIAHIFLILPPSTTENIEVCRWVSIAIHFFFTACYIFIMLEALHMYSLVAFVVKKDGMFSRFQNILIGWCLAVIITMFCICFQYENYGGEYHCWLRMDTPLLYAQLVPVIIFVTVTITLVEAAGSSNYKPLKGVDIKQRRSAKISQRTNLVILPFMIGHWILGMLSEYEQNLPLYGTFSVVNGIFGFLVFFLHCTNNQEVRDKLSKWFKSVRGKK